MAKAKAYKLKFRPTPISRLKHYVTPLKMVGDPPWYGYGKSGWHSREKAVYAHEMDRKVQDGRGWSNAVYYQARDDNERIDALLKCKWIDYEDALVEVYHREYEEALRDNAAWEYHHDNYIAA